MLEYETYTEKKWLEGLDLWEDPIYLRREDSRVENKSGRKHHSGESIMNHLYDVEMTWWSHGKFAWRMSLKLFLLSLTALVHGMLPFIFLSTTSDGIKKLTHDLDQRDNT